jgi:glycosyltransferase involved in cell wall biosynthesis
VTRSVALGLDQFFRPQPGGIATYVRGLVHGLAGLADPSLHLVGVGARGTPVLDITDLELERRDAPLPVALLTRAWSRWSVGVPATCDVVHATSVAGPFGGGTRGAVHSVAVHDLLWRDEPAASTPRGVRFHEARLQLIKRREGLRVITTSPGLDARLASEGVDPGRLHPSRLGVDDAGAPCANASAVRALLAARGVEGPFTLYAGTREPRKNLERLAAAHRRAYADHRDLGPLVLVGPAGWGAAAPEDAVALGSLNRDVLRGLYRDAAVVAYVPRAEGFGLPPVEALALGTRVVASTTTPSVAHNDEAVRVDPLDVDAIAAGLVAALTRDDGPASRERRRASVADLTWRNVALDHLAAWR